MAARKSMTGARTGALAVAVAIALLTALALASGSGAARKGVAAATVNPIAAAKAEALKYMNANTTWRGPTSSPPAKKGVKVAIISCSQVTTGCHRPTEAAVEAAKAIGWQPTVFDGQGQPTQMLKAVESAVNSHYNAIILMLITPDDVSEGLNMAKAAHIPVVTLGEPNYTKTRATTWNWIPDVSHDWLGSGKAIGNYMIWKSNGKVDALLMDGADTVVVQLGQFKGTYSVLANKKACPACKVSVKKFTIATLTTLPAQLATAGVQADPKLNWVWCYDFCLYQAITKLKANGLARAGLQGAGFDCNAENLNLMRTGVVQSVCAADARDWEAWATIDEANRLLQGKPAVDEHPPFRLFDRSTLKDLTKQDLADGWQGGLDFRARFKSLWGVK